MSGTVLLHLLGVGHWERSMGVISGVGMIPRIGNRQILRNPMSILSRFRVVSLMARKCSGGLLGRRFIDFSSCAASLTQWPKYS